MELSSRDFTRTAFQENIINNIDRCIKLAKEQHDKIEKSREGLLTARQKAMKELLTANGEEYIDEPIYTPNRFVCVFVARVSKDIYLSKHMLRWKLVQPRGLDESIIASPEEIKDIFHPSTLKSYIDQNDAVNVLTFEF